MRQETTTYTPKSDSFVLSIKKLYKYRSLIWVFAKRDLQVKYAQTTLGFLWGLFKPLFGVFIYVFFFGILLNWKTTSIPYPLYVLSGLIGWNLFSYIVLNGVSAIQESADLIKKVYFPKAILPLSKTVSGAVESLISLLLIIPLLFYYQIELSWNLIFIPLVLFFNVICGLAVTFFIASISIKRRDLIQVLPFLLNMAIWCTPVFLSADLFPKRFQYIFEVNPVANVIDAWRWVLLDGVDFELTWIANFIIASVLLAIGFYFYSKRENKFADFI
jgi:lipopolysaccharide transport system permease protein